MNPYFIAGTVLAVICAYGVGHWQGDDAGQAKVQAKWDQERAKLAEEYAANVTAMREKEQAMQSNADKLRQEKDIEIRNLNARSIALSNSLRERPNRTESSGVSQTPGAGQSGCTGKELYREDGNVLIGIAREADELRLALKQCYSQYEALK
jgi:hypothetical protein